MRRTMPSAPGAVCTCSRSPCADSNLMAGIRSIAWASGVTDTVSKAFAGAAAKEMATARIAARNRNNCDNRINSWADPIPKRSSRRDVGESSTDDAGFEQALPACNRKTAVTSPRSDPSRRMPGANRAMESRLEKASFMTESSVQAYSDAEQRLGVLLVLGAAIAWSVSGVFARLITVDLWTATSTRALFAAFYMGVGLLAVHRGRSLAVML
eukprot:gene6666-8852_t